MSLLELRGVDKRFGTGARSVVACQHVDLDVDAGEVLGLVGESGSGKSTLANLVLGLLLPDRGEIAFDGRPLGDWLRSDPRGYRSDVQAVFQQPLLALDRRRSIRWCVAEPLVIHGIGNRTARHRRVDELLESVGLPSDVADRRPAELSGGQLQRVNIARALALEPRLLVCDEPVSALDVSVQAQVLNLFLEIQRRLGTSMLFVGHDLAAVRHVSDRIAVMCAGRIVECGPAEQVCRDPHHPYTRALLAAARDARAPGERELVAEVTGLPDDGRRFAPRCPPSQEES